MHIYNDKLLITSTRIFYKNGSVSLDCINISELCSATNNSLQLLLFMKTSHHSIKLKH